MFLAHYDITKFDKYNLENTITANILLQVLTARLNYTAETKEIAETRFSESEFVMQCLEWHNNYREIHCAPPLQFDAIVSYICATTVFVLISG